MQDSFTLDDVHASPTPKDLRHPNGRSMPVHEYKFADGSAALVQWSRWYGASIALHKSLSVLDKLRSLRWAAEVLEEHVQTAPESDLRRVLVSVDDLPFAPAQTLSAPAVVVLDGPEAGR